MPYRRKKRPWRRRRRRRRRALVTPRQPLAAIAKSQIVKMKYGTFISINPTAGVAGSYVFSANNIFDPDTTGAGHQPMGMDEWAFFYNHYTVLGSKIRATFSPTSGTALTGQALCAVSVEDDSATTATATTSLLERSGVHYRALGSSSASSGVTIGHSYNAKRFFAVKDVGDNTDRLGALMNSNPAEQAYYHVKVGAIDGASDPSAVTVCVVIEYTVLLSERNKLLQS